MGTATYQVEEHPALSPAAEHCDRPQGLRLPYSALSTSLSACFTDEKTKALLVTGMGMAEEVWWQPQPSSGQALCGSSWYNGPSGGYSPPSQALGDP